MSKQHMMFASYIAPAWFLKEPSIEREHQNFQYLWLHFWGDSFSLDWISSWIARFCGVSNTYTCVFSSYDTSLKIWWVKFWLHSLYPRHRFPGEECSPVALRLAEPWSRAGLGCLAAALATLFRDGERLWRADTLFWSALLEPTSKEERQDYTNMQTLG